MRRATVLMKTIYEFLQKRKPKVGRIPGKDENAEFEIEEQNEDVRLKLLEVEGMKNLY